MFRDPERVAALLNDPKRPVQFIFSGKAHPKDNGGKELISRVVQMAKRPEFRRRVVFLEDYEMNVARHMVPGRRRVAEQPPPAARSVRDQRHEGRRQRALNMSILDGWWEEGYDGDNGWAIGAGEEYTDLGYQDEVESRALYELFENDLTPMFYTRGGDGLPRAWIRRMKRCISTLVPVFNTNRMVEEYLEQCYVPSHRRYTALAANGLKAAAGLAGWRLKLAQAWPGVKVEGVDAPQGQMLRVGADFPVQVHVQLGGLSPDEVDVQLCHGLLDSHGQVSSPTAVSLKAAGANGSAATVFAGTVKCPASGQFGYSVRVAAEAPAPAEPVRAGAGDVGVARPRLAA